MSKNPAGTRSRSNMEWGKNRKEEDRLRNTANRGRREAIAEQSEPEPEEG